MAITPYTIAIVRESPWDDSYDIYARSNGTPIEEGDGVTVGSISILPWQSSVSLMWTPPGAGTWKFLIIPKRWNNTGVGSHS